MEKRILQKAAATISLFGMCFSFAFGSYAAWKITGDTDNILTMASYKTEITEQYEQPEHVDPSEEVTKIVNVSNTGDVDTIVRVTLTKQFGTKDGSGSFKVDEALDPEMILIEYNTEFWVEKDGFFYYKEILKAGETTREPLMSSFQLSPDAGNQYKGKEARIVVHMESVQAEGNAVSAWGIAYRDLGMEVPKAPPSKITSVAYKGKEQGFDITKSRTDLFANFKNLLPGCARTQNIRIKNDSNEAAEILLHAEAAEQERMTSGQRKLMDEMLEKYAVIEIRNGGTTVYKGPVSGNLDGAGASMRNAVSLGKLDPGKKSVLTVKLELDPQMDNKYLALVGKVKWVFTAQGDEIETGAIYPAKTGLVNRAVISYTFFFFFLVVGMAGTYYGRRGKA